MTQHAVVTGFLDIEDLAFERQNGLEAAIAALLRGASGRFSLNQKQLALFGITFLAVGQFARQPTGIECAFAAGKVACFACSFAGA